MKIILAILMAILPTMLCAQYSIHTDIYIERTNTDSVYREITEADINQDKFLLIRGQDTLIRKVYHVQGGRYELSCGDHVHLEISFGGKFWGLHYREGNNLFFISRNIDPAK